MAPFLCLPQKLRMAGERVKIFDLFNDIEDAVDRSNQLVEMLISGGQRDQLEQFDGILGRLAELDRNLDVDIRTVDDTFRQFGTVETEKRVLAKQFSENRKNVQVPANAGRSQPNIAAIRKKLEAALKSAMDGTAQNDGGDQLQGEEEEEDMQFTENVLSAKDPITKRDIKDPVKNSICGHIYDRQAVHAFIEECRERRQLCQCPVQLCRNKKLLQMAQMVPCPDFFKMIQRQRRSMSRGVGSSQGH
uniref:E3 SUMO-protein ligase NSE2 n=1 Tax=Globodera rostochiensis TaxID=31243 RepID=A0A914I869_GLORO